MSDPISMLNFPNRKTTTDLRCLVCDVSVPAGSWVLPLPDGECACCASCVGKLLDEDSVLLEIREAHESHGKALDDQERLEDDIRELTDGAEEAKSEADDALEELKETRAEDVASAQALAYIQAMKRHDEISGQIEDAREKLDDVKRELEDPDHYFNFTGILYDMAEEADSHNNFETLIAAPTSDDGAVTTNLFG